MKKVLCLVVCALHVVCGYTQSFSWAKGMMDSSNHPLFNSVYSVTVDNEHNVIITGGYQGTIMIDSVTLTGRTNPYYPNNQLQNGYLIKFDSSGKLLWARNLTSSGRYPTVTPSQLAVDPDGNIFIVGNFVCNAIYFTSTDSLQNVTKNIYSQNGFLAKYDKDGNYQWSASTNGVSLKDNTSALAVAYDPLNNSVVWSGFFEDSINLDGTILKSRYTTELFVARYTSAGSLAWAVQAGGVNGSAVTSLACDNTGNVYATGFLTGDINFYGDTIHCNNGHVLTFKLDQLGNFKWGNIDGGKMGIYNVVDIGNSITTDNYGNAYYCGFLLDTIIFKGLDPIRSYYSPFVAKVSGTGVKQWLKTLGYGHLDDAMSVSLDGNGYPYVIGTYDSATVIDTTHLSQPDTCNIFISKISPDGDTSWNISTGGNHWNYGYGIAIDKFAPAIYATGAFDEATTFGSITITSPYTGNYAKNLFVAKLDSINIPEKSALTPVLTKLLSSFSVYPNPATNNLQLTFSQAIDHAIKITDLSGKIVMQTNTKQNNVSLNISNLPAGLYNITVTSGLNIDTKLFVKTTR